MMTNGNVASMRALTTRSEHHMFMGGRMQDTKNNLAFGNVRKDHLGQTGHVGYVRFFALASSLRGSADLDSQVRKKRDSFATEVPGCH